MLINVMLIREKTCINFTYIHYNKNPVWVSIRLIFRSLLCQKSTLRWTKNLFFTLNPRIQMFSQISHHVTFYLIDPIFSRKFHKKVKCILWDISRRMDHGRTSTSTRKGYYTKYFSGYTRSLNYLNYTLSFFA